MKKEAPCFVLLYPIVAHNWGRKNLDFPSSSPIKVEHSMASSTDECWSRIMVNPFAITVPPYRRPIPLFGDHPRVAGAEERVWVSEFTFYPAVPLDGAVEVKELVRWKFPMEVLIEWRRQTRFDGLKSTFLPDRILSTCKSADFKSYSAIQSFHNPSNRPGKRFLLLPRELPLILP